MRIQAFTVFVFCALASCQSLKPVVGKTASAPAPKSSEPKYIENVVINPAEKKSNPANNRTVAEKPKVPATGNEFSAYSSLQFKYSILIDVPVENLTNQKLLEFMEEWYGTKYRFGGSGKDGIDCSAFSGNLLLTVFGLQIPRIAKDQYTACKRIKRDELEAGDLVFFHTTRRGISHVGVYLANGKFIHASTAYGVTISDLNDGYYARTFVAGGRPRSAYVPQTMGN